MVALRLLVIAAVGFGLSAPGASSAPQPHTVTDLATTISSKGLGCHDFQAATPPNDALEGTCTVGHEFGVTLDVLSSHAVLAKQLPKAVAAVCAALRRVKSPPKIVFVVGPNWVATFESRVNSQPLAKAMNAKIEALKCKR